MNKQIIEKGAESIIILEKNFIIKSRISKNYRHSEIDEQIRKRRTKSENKILTKASKIINSPLSTQEEFDKIKMPFIKGKKLSVHLDEFDTETQKEIAKKIGEQIGKLHKNDIIHGDLTTSNMILKGEIQKKQEPKPLAKDPLSLITKPKNNSPPANQNEEIKDSKKENNFKIFFIDFGLGFISKKQEDKAVDLHLLKQALVSKHFKSQETLLKEIFKAYEKEVEKTESQKTFERLIAIEKRGRYRH